MPTIRVFYNDLSKEVEAQPLADSIAAVVANEIACTEESVAVMVLATVDSYDGSGLPKQHSFANVVINLEHRVPPEKLSALKQAVIREIASQFKERTVAEVEIIFLEESGYIYPGITQA